MAGSCQRAVLSLCLAALCSCSPNAEVVRGDALVALEGATLIDGRGGPPIENTAIVLDGSRVVRVGLVGDFAYPDGTEVADVTGHYIIPGLVNTHAHMFEGFPQLLLGFGITTVRNPGSGADEGVEGASLGISLRRALEAGDVTGPRMVTAGRIINNSAVFTPQPGGARAEDTGVAGNYAEVRTEEQIRQEVALQLTAGYDLVKFYMGIEPALLRAGVEEAHSRGARAIAHLKATSWLEAANAGVNGLMHSCSEGPSWELVGGSVAGSWAESLREWAASASQISLDGEPWQELLSTLVSNGTEVNATLSTMEALYWADVSESLRSALPSIAPRDYPDRWSARWDAQASFMTATQGFGETDFAGFRAAFTVCLEMIRSMHEAGVLITAGDDVGGWMTPGVSFHRELQLLSQAGIPNSDVLRIATWNGAVALGLSSEVGTVEPGKQADLVVLAASPLDDISNTQTIQAIYLGGRRFEPTELLSGG